MDIASATAKCPNTMGKKFSNSATVTPTVSEGSGSLVYDCSSDFLFLRFLFAVLSKVTYEEFSSPPVKSGPPIETDFSSSRILSVF